MRSLSLCVAAAVAILASGCSGSSNASSDASAAPPPTGPATTDKRTGITVYPGAMQSSTSDSNDNKMTTYMTSDAQATVAAWYKTALPSYTETDNSANSDPTYEFDKKSGDKQTDEVSLSKVGDKTFISLEHYK